jgi:hypothetical protein
MEYYARPEGTERMLRSRIRRCYVALVELEQPVNYLHSNIGHLNEHYAVEDVNQMHEMYREAACAILDVTNFEVFDNELGVERAQELLLTLPMTAENVCQKIEHIHSGAKVVIRNLEYQLDAGHFDPADDIYQTMREKTVMVLGLTEVILDAIDSGFIMDVRTYNEYGV